MEDNAIDASFRPDWDINEIDLNQPNAARMYDYLLGGYHNFEIDRMYVEKVLEVFPDTALHAKISRRILARSVRLLVEQGIDQFLDIGSGIPTAGAAHEIARFFIGSELIEPGIVHLPLWHPDSPADPMLDEPGRSMSLVGLGRKP